MRIDDLLSTPPQILRSWNSEQALPLMRFRACFEQQCEWLCTESKGGYICELGLERRGMCLLSCGASAYEQVRAQQTIKSWALSGVTSAAEFCS